MNFFKFQVIGTRGSEVLFEFESQRFPTEQMAVHYGAFDIFHHMHQAVENCKLQPPNQSAEGIPRYKFEASRS